MSTSTSRTRHKLTYNSASYKHSQNVATGVTQLQADAKLHFVHSFLRVLSCKHETCLHLHVRDSVHSVIGKVQSLSALRERVWPWTNIVTPRNVRKQRGPCFLQLCACAPLPIPLYTNIPATCWTRKFKATIFACFRSHVSYMDMTKSESPPNDWIEELEAYIVQTKQCILNWC